MAQQRDCGGGCEHHRRGALQVPDIERAAGSFMALLVGDLTVRLVLGAIATPTPEELTRRAALARAAFARLWVTAA